MNRALHQCSAMLIKHLAQEKTLRSPATPKQNEYIHLLLMAEEPGALSLSIPHSLGCSGSKSTPIMSSHLAGNGKSWQHRDRKLLGRKPLGAGRALHGRKQVFSWLVLQAAALGSITVRIPRCLGF